MEFWNSAEILGKTNTFLQMGLIFFSIVTGLVGAASFAVSYRKASLAPMQEATFKEHVGTNDERTSDIKALKGREFSAAQAGELKVALQGTTAVDVLVIRHNSKESQHYSSQIEASLKAVGWNIKHFCPVTRTRKSSPPKMSLNKRLTELKQFNLLKSELKDMGLPFTFDQFNGDIEQHIILDVGVIPANEYQSLIDKIQ